MSTDLIKVLVEIPKGSRNKYERNPETGELELDRRIFASVAYPTEYGHVPETRAEDGDELDALVVVSEPTFPGCIIRARPVAVLRMVDAGGDANHKVVCVPTSDPSWSDVCDVGDLPNSLLEEIHHFFEVYLQLRNAGPDVQGWGSHKDAVELVDRAAEAYRAREQDTTASR